ncbi:MAG TPA: flagellar filament capping protein FliD [Gemmatirosa sp.]|nr:flagellar filament capping protein FliD [Gemmatirosa sp.]
MADPISSIPGVSSGVDWKALVEQIVSLERRPAVRLETTIAANARRKAALNDFQQALQALRTAADALDADAVGAGAGGALASFTATASGLDAAGRAVLAATVGAGATPGSYGLTVTQVASAQKLTAGAGLAPATTLTPGTLTLRRPGTASGDPPLATLVVTASDTVVTLRDRINQLNAGTGATGIAATLIGVSATDQRLSLSATAAGAANGFVLDDGGSGLLAQLGLDAGGATPPFAVAAQDAIFRVDGVEVTRPTNTVGDVVPGVTLTLSAVGDATLDVARNTQATADAAKAFVEAYNKVVAFVKEQSVAGKPLAGDSLLRTVRGALSRPLLAAGTTADGGALPADLATLGAAGIALQKDGTLALDAARVQSLSGARAADLTALLASRMGALSDYLGTLAQPLTGLVDQRESGIDTQSAALQARVTQIDARLDKKRTALLAQYSKFEASLGRLNALQSTMSAQFAGLDKRSER